MEVVQAFRRRFTPATIIATMALFFSLTGAGLTAAKYILGTDLISAASDLTGTYGTPLIGSGKVTSPKIADGAVTSAKLAATTIAPDAAKLGGFAASSYLNANAVKMVGPVAVIDTPGDFQVTTTTLATIGPLTIKGHCQDQQAPGLPATVYFNRLSIESSEVGSVFRAKEDGPLTFPAESKDNGGMIPGTEYTLGSVIATAGYFQFLTRVSGTAVSADGQQVGFDVYMAGIGPSTQCTFGGIFMVNELGNSA